MAVDDVKSTKALVDHTHGDYYHGGQPASTSATTTTTLSTAAASAIDRNNSLARLFASEFIGTFLFVYIGQCVITSFELTGTQSESSIKLLGTLICYSLSLLVAVLLTYSVSGGHLNPAITVAAAAYGHLQWHKVPIYLLGQYGGSFFAACFIHITYNDKIAHRHAEGLLNGMNMTLRAHGNILSSGKFFTTFPPIEVSLTQLFISYSLATANFTLLLMSIYESKLVHLPRYLQPVYIAIALLITQAAFCANGGPTINPAVDFSPRLYISLSGWGGSAFNLYNFTYWWLCGIMAPHLGALMGAGLYKLLINLHREPPYLVGSLAHHHHHHRQQQQQRQYGLYSNCSGDSNKLSNNRRVEPCMFGANGRRYIAPLSHHNENTISNNNNNNNNIINPSNSRSSISSTFSAPNDNNNNNNNTIDDQHNQDNNIQDNNDNMATKSTTQNDNNAQLLLHNDDEHDDKTTAHRERQRVSTSTMISNLSCDSRTLLNTTENMRQHANYLDKALYHHLQQD